MQQWWRLGGCQPHCVFFIGLLPSLCLLVVVGARAEAGVHRVVAWTEFRRLSMISLQLT
jgi:hypothetical protein